MEKQGIFITALIICSGLINIVCADTSWNVASGTWSNSSNWDNGLPDTSDSYIYIRYSSASICTLNSDEGLFPARLVMQNGQTLSIDNSGYVGTAWARVGHESGATVNLSGNGTFVLNEDDLWLGTDGGNCVWTMSDSSSLTTVSEDGSSPEELFIADDGGSATLQLVGSGVTVSVQGLHLGYNTATPQATLEYVMDAGGASPIVTETTGIAESGQAHLVLSASTDLSQQDIVLIETTGTAAIGGSGVFNTMNGGSAAEGAIVDLGGNTYSLTYQYDLGGDSADNDVALLFVGTTPYASEPSPKIGEETDGDDTVLMWRSAQGIVRNEIYLGTDAALVANAQKPAGDVNADGVVDFLDLNEMALQWLAAPSAPCPDLDGSGIVDLPDFAKLSLDWLKSADTIYLGATSGSTFDPGVLDASKTYYWRVDSVRCDGIEPGNIWNFQTKLPAFPGAEGFGKWASGGRGDSVYHVTNLDDSGTGSFRDAVSATNRTVVFNVGGVINIDERIVVSKDITIAGQTAPGEGVMIYGNGLSFTDANRSITRYMRFRMGIGGTSGKDAITVADGTDMMFDHCSISWGRDENFSVSGGTGEDPGFITIQNCIIAQGLETHSCGGLITDWNGISILRSLYIDNDTRNPKVRGINEFINNVVYNWDDAGYIMGDTTNADSFVNVVNNYFISGNNTGSTPFKWGTPNFHIYHSNNWHDSDKDGSLDGRLLTDSDYIDNGDVTVMSTPYDYPSVVTLLDPVTAIKAVGSRCGASFPVRDRTDTRLIKELMSYGTTGQLISDENDSPMYGVGTLANGVNPTDTDQDGMPDYWEASLSGLNPIVADNNGDVNDNGYTNLEDYLNWLAVLHADVPKNAYADIDLRTFTSGFSAGATYTVSDAVHGTVVILADGYTARYTPDTDYLGLAEFSFTITDGSNVMTDVVSLLVSEYGGHPLAEVYPTDLVNGLDYSYYEGTWQYLPDFDSLIPDQTGYVSNFDISSAPAEDGFAYEFEGFIDVPTDGQYTFYTNSDDGSRLYIDGGVVVSNDGVHGTTEALGKAALLAGMHVIRVTFFENDGSQTLEVRWAGPGFTRQLIPDALLYRGTLDTVPPAVPAGLWAQAANAQDSLDWQDNGEADLAGYNVYRTTTSGSSYIQVNTSLLTTSDYTDTDVINGVLYHYIVRAVDTAMNESEDTSEVSARPVASGTAAIIQENTVGFCSVDGTIDSNNAGFTGDGFSNTDNDTSTGIDWKVNIATAGDYTITWRYANGGGSDRPGTLLVDGSTAVSSISFPATADWTTWDEVSQTVSLSLGAQTLRLEATGSNGLGNIDYIEIVGANVIPSDCL